MEPLLVHEQRVGVPRAARRSVRVARLLGPVPLLGLLAIPLAAAVLHHPRAPRSLRDDARNALVTSGGLHAVIGLFAFLVTAMG